MKKLWRSPKVIVGLMFLAMLVFLVAACSGGANFFHTPLPDGGGDGDIDQSFITNTFMQPAQGVGDIPIDLIFIMDTSGSLDEERIVIGDNVDAILQELQAQNLSDYRVAVMAAHSLSDFAGRPLTSGRTHGVLHEGLFSASTNACGDGTTDPFEQLKCDFKANIIQADADPSTGTTELLLQRAPKYSLPDNPYRFIPHGTLGRSVEETLYEDTESNSDYRPQGEFGLRSIEVAISDKLASNQAQGILRPDASWNFIVISDENDICVKQSFIDTGFNNGGMWYSSTWDDGNWNEAYGYRDFCTSSFDGKHISAVSMLGHLQALRAGKHFSLHTFGYFDLPGYQAPSFLSQESHSIGYWEATEAVGGKLIDLGDTSQFSQALTDIGEQISLETQLEKTFCLTHEPQDPLSIVCRVDGAPATNYFNNNPTACPETSHHAAVWLPFAGTFQSSIVCEYDAL